MPNHEFTTEEELVLKSLAAGLKKREIEEMLLDPEDAPAEVYVKSALTKLGLATKRELLNYVRIHYSDLQIQQRHWRHSRLRCVRSR